MFKQLLLYIKSKRKNSFFKYLKEEHKIPISHFVIFYWTAMCKSILFFGWSYFRYTMLIIFRRTLIVWSAALIYINFTIDQIRKYIIISYNEINQYYIYFINNIDLFHKILYIISALVMFCICMKILWKVLSKLYNFLFIYRDLLDFNDRVSKFYEVETTNFIINKSKKLTPEEKKIQKETLKHELYDLNPVKKIKKI